MSTFNDQALCVAAFMGGQGEKAGGIGYSEKVAPTIKSVMSGGNTVPDVVYALQGNGIDRAETAGCNGKGWREDVCYTLNTIDRPAVAYGQMLVLNDQGGDSISAESGELSPTLRAQAHQHDPIVIYDTRGNGDGHTVPTLTGDHQNRVTDYTSVLVMAHGQANAEVTKDMSPTLNCNHEQPIAAYGVDCRNVALDEEKSHTLQAKANGGQSLNCTPCVLTNGKPPRRYIVRRIIPLECCRLQGFPDGWGDTAKKDGFSEEEYRFWLTVRQTKESINGKEPKHYTMAQMLTWYNKLHTDSAEYKMWGNGIALPCAVFVLGGVIEAMQIDR